MAYIKKLVIQGFKSFAGRTEIIFDKGINTIIGPNGSGKSNISDALCFVLGRLSSKSLRAAKSSNLIFQGSKERKPAQEAHVVTENFVFLKIQNSRSRRVLIDIFGEDYNVGIISDCLGIYDDFKYGVAEVRIGNFDNSLPQYSGYNWVFVRYNENHN